MDNNNTAVFDKCTTCSIWLPVEKGPDGKNYCSLHINKKREESGNKKRAKTGDKWLGWFRGVINSEPELNP